MLTQEQNTALVGSGTLTMLMECWLYLMHLQSQPTVYYKRDQIVRHTAFRTKCLSFPHKEESCHDVVFEMSGYMESLLGLQPALRPGGRVGIMAIYCGQPV